MQGAGWQTSRVLRRLRFLAGAWASDATPTQRHTTAEKPRGPFLPSLPTPLTGTDIYNANRTVRRTDARERTHSTHNARQPARGLESLPSRIPKRLGRNGSSNCGWRGGLRKKLPHRLERRIISHEGLRILFCNSVMPPKCRKLRKPQRNT